MKTMIFLIILASLPAMLLAQSPHCLPIENLCRASPLTQCMKKLGNGREDKDTCCNIYRKYCHYVAKDDHSAYCQDLRSLLEIAVSYTNEVRLKHGVPGLKMSDYLNNVAQDHANRELEKQIRVGGLADVDHSGNSYGGMEFGENIFAATGDYTIFARHATQVIWKSTRYVGHGFAFNSDCSKMIMVANYFPAGNVKQEYAENVLPKMA